MYLDLEELESLTSNFDPSIKESKYVKSLMEHVDKLKKVSIGSDYTNFIMDDTSGNSTELSSIIGNNATDAKEVCLLELESNGEILSNL